ncbi:GGDEF domain-containing protein [Chromohalobacter canadensis]|uniref:diguanylate cyclase n=1 Tax=Chromohalobacter canadensis TaxID=141389 RepID=A0ABZ0YAK0_9GAMM|nr:sensor domain-containing diguanylate cyclase [Chromohalobacter canadensis]MCK0768139.1 diguanylate cyclase [Chromohalobacter canadensis]WQH08873.1 diguanylate cyclase [Chromohalobacter canadensis]
MSIISTQGKQPLTFKRQWVRLSVLACVTTILLSWGIGASHWPWFIQAIALSLLIPLGVGCVLVRIDRDLLSPMRRLSEHARRLHEGDNTHLMMTTYLTERSDEVGELARQFQHLVEDLKIHNAQLLEQSLVDPLTKLGNRRMLENRLDVALPLTRRLDCTVSVLMMDVDHFKLYNDHYGHPAGDQCLVQISGVLRDTFRRETDIVVRLGGEEFLVLLIDTPSQEAWRLADAMRGMIQAMGIPHEYSPTAEVVTVSVGVVTSPPGVGADIDDMIACADEALYACKAQGRNTTQARMLSSPTEAIEPPAEAIDTQD